MAAYQAGDALGQKGDFAAAIREYEKAIALAPRVYGADDPRTANLLNNLALLHERLGRYAEAEGLYRRSLKIWESKPDSDALDLTNGLNNLASLYQRTDHYDKAEALLRRSLAIRTAKHLDETPCLSYLAQLYEVMGQDDKAEPLLRRSLALRQSRLPANHPDVAQSQHDLATYYALVGRYAEALPLFQSSLKTLAVHPGHPDTAYSYSSLGELHLKVGQYAQAKPLLERSRVLWEKSLGRDHPCVAYALHNLALLHAATGDNGQAELLFQKSLKIYHATFGPNHPDVADSLSHLAKLYGSMQRWQEAAAATERARRTLRRHIGRVLPILSESEQLKFLQNRDQPSFHEALSLGLALRNDAGVASQSAGWVLNGKAVAQQALAGRILMARESQEAQTAEVLRQLIAVRKQLAALAFPASTPPKDAGQRHQVDQLAQQEQQLAKQISQAGGRPVGGEPWVEFDDVRKALPNDSILIEIAKFRVRNFQAKGTEEAWQTPHYAAWIIPPAGRGAVALVDLGEGAKIETAVRAACLELKAAQKNIKTIGEPDSERASRRALEQLAQLVLRPLARHIGQAERWIISADADLWLVPWSALPLEDGRYAIEKHTISYVVSGRDLVAAPTQRKTTRPVVMADPDYDFVSGQSPAEPRKPPPGPAPSRGRRELSRLAVLAQVPRLPGTALEAQAIVPKLRSYARAEPAVYTDKQALEGVVKALHSPKVLVLSTHGFFFPDQENATAAEVGGRGRRSTGTGITPLENPLLRCGLLLAGANQRAKAQAAGDEDGVLTGLEIIGIELRGTELVVLSACETGLGEVHVGEGVAGLRQAFHLAGARTVVATLWQIHDRETARLMDKFFTHLAAGMGNADALRQAQLDQIQALRARHGAAHPFYWAAFTVTGS